MSVWDLNLISLFAVLAMMVFILWGYLPLMSLRGRAWENYMARGTGILLLAATIRMLYWDGTRYLPGMDWAHFRDSLGGIEINVLFNGLVLIAGYQFLKGRLLLIPEDDRDEYRWWNAWKYPSDRCVIRGRFRR